jgi:hypothetical protein
MTKFNRPMSRRALLRGMATLSSLLLLARWRVRAANLDPTSAQASAYGQGPYSQGTYPGLQITYLPLVHQEDS